MIDLDLKLSHKNFQLSAKVTLKGSAITGLVGPSGSGKSSLLRAISGLEAPTDGKIAFNGHIWFEANQINLSPQDRPVAVVFQDMRLFPHLTVAENLALAAQWGKAPQLSDEIIDALELRPLMLRNPSALSGGEARRVALARALAQAPDLLLLDEPMAGLDSHQRGRILPFISRALDAANLPALYVSHDTEEVAQLCATKLVVEELSDNDCRRFQIGSTSACGVQIPCNVVDWAQDMARLRFGSQTIEVSSSVPFEGGSSAFLQTLPETLIFSQSEISASEAFSRLHIRCQSDGIFADDALLFTQNTPSFELISGLSGGQDQATKEGWLFFRPSAVFKHDSGTDKL